MTTFTCNVHYVKRTFISTSSILVSGMYSTIHVNDMLLKLYLAKYFSSILVFPLKKCSCCCCCFVCLSISYVLKFVANTHRESGKSCHVNDTFNILLWHFCVCLWWIIEQKIHKFSVSNSLFNRKTMM